MAPMTPTAPIAPIHIPPPPKDKVPKVRRHLMFFDRIKVLLLIAAIIGFAAAKQASDIPILSFYEALQEQLRAKQWLLWLAGIEVIRQIHYLISNKSRGWHHFWSWKVFGGWDRFWGRRNQWLRFRLGRVFRTLVWGTIIVFWLAFLWDLRPLDALVAAPSKLWNNAFSSGGEMPFIISVAFTLMFGIGQFVAIFWFMSRGGVDTYMPDEIETRFDDVWGQDKVLDKVRENIMFLDNPEKIEEKGGHVPSGILLWGPPGTGKTLIAKAVAGETGRPYVFVDPGAFQNMFFGVGILKVKGLFKKLRKLALRHGGVIVFFDEADSLGSRGGTVSGAGATVAPSMPARCNGAHYVSEGTAEFLRSVEMRQAAATAPAEANGSTSRIKQIVTTGMGGGGMGTLQALLTELSGLEKPKGWLGRRIRAFLCMPGKRPPKYRILMMMATNLPDALDPALLRPGRLDRIYKVDYPSVSGRKRTYEGYLDKVQHAITPDQVERISLMSPRGTGAQIKDIVNESLIVAMKNGRDTVTWPDLLKAKQLKTYGMADDVHSVALERHGVALHEASHAVAMKLLKKQEMIDVATIEPRGAVGGFVAPVPLQEQGFPWKNLQEDEIITFLASLAGERHFFDGDNSVGVGGDLGSSTTLAMAMEGYAAMGGTLASHSVLFAVDGDKTRTTFNEAVEKRLQELYERAQKLIADNEHLVMAVSHALEQHHTISGEDVDAIFNGTHGPLADGAWYRTQEFRIAYRRYHEAALEAHRRQGKLDMPLPMPGQVVILSAGEVANVGVLDRYSPALGTGDSAWAPPHRTQPDPAGDRTVENGPISNGASGNGASGNGASGNGSVEHEPAQAKPDTNTAW